MSATGAVMLIANTMSVLVARLLVPLFSFALNVWIARNFGVEVLGLYGELISLLFIFQALAALGMPALIAREIASRPAEAERFIATARAVAIAGGIAASLGFLAYSRAFLPPSAQTAALFFALAVLPSGWISIQEATFVASRTHHWITVVALAEHGPKMVIAMAALALGGGVASVAIAIAVGRMSALVLGQRLAARVLPGGGARISFGGMRDFLVALAPFAALFAMSHVYFRIDVLIIAALRGQHDAGLYTAALSLFAAALVLPDSLMTAVFPRLARFFGTSPDNFGRVTWAATTMIGLSLVPVAVGLIVLAEPLILTIYGGQFSTAALPLQLLCASLPLHGVNVALGQGLQAGRHQGKMLSVVIFTVMAHLVLSAGFVMWRGPQGAALAMAASAAIASVGSLMAFHKYIARFERSSWVLWHALFLAPFALVLWSPSGFVLIGAAAVIAALAVIRILVDVAAYIGPDALLRFSRAIYRAPVV